MSKICDSAKDEDCQVRLVNICNFDERTTVFAHLGGAGWALKQPDFLGAYCCSSCHDVIDGRVKSSLTKDELKLDFYDAMVRTQLILIEKGLIIIK